MSVRAVKSVTLLASVAALGVLFAANARYVYSDALHQLPQLTAGHIADPRFAGSTFRFDGLVTGVSTLDSGMLIIGLRNGAADVQLDAAVFPSVGCLPHKPARGESVRVVGNLGMYRGRPQLKPLSAAHVDVISPHGAPIPLADAVSAAHAGETLRVGPLTATSVEPFTSRRGLEHVRLTLAAASTGSAEKRATVQGVMFQGDRTDCELRLLRSAAPVVVTAEIDEYQGSPSLVVKRVVSSS